MHSLLQGVDDFLRGKGLFAAEVSRADARDPRLVVRQRLAWLVAFVVVAGAFYGMVMGTYSGLAPGRYHQLLYSGVKVPLLMLAGLGLCLPSFFVLNTLAGLRDDFSEALGAVVASQACLAVVLAPITALFYASCAHYPLAILFNAAMFGVACVAG